MSGKRRERREWTAEQKLEIVLAGLRDDTTVLSVCRKHEIAPTLYYQWRDQFLAAGKLGLAGRGEASTTERELQRRISHLERTLGRKTLELEIAGKLVRDWE